MPITSLFATITTPRLLEWQLPCTSSTCPRSLISATLSSSSFAESGASLASSMCTTTLLSSWFASMALVSHCTVLLVEHQRRVRWRCLLHCHPQLFCPSCHVLLLLSPVRYESYLISNRIAPSTSLSPTSLKSLSPTFSCSSFSP